MRTFGLHLLLSLTATFLFFNNSGVLPYNATTSAFVCGLIFGFLWLSALAYNREYFRKLPKALGFLLFFIKEVFVANIKIAYDIITPRFQLQPTVVALPLSVKTDFEIMLLANMITLTPGSLSLDVSDDKKILYVHVLYLEQGGQEEIIRKIKWGFERRLLSLTT